jgi:hypothetical protein
MQLCIHATEQFSVRIGSRAKLRLCLILNHRAIPTTIGGVSKDRQGVAGIPFSRKAIRICQWFDVFCYDEAPILPTCKQERIPT